MHWFSYLNPVNALGTDKYHSVSQWLFEHLFTGFWAKLLAIICLCLAFWIGVRKQRFSSGLTLFIFAILLTYGWVLKFLFNF